MEPFNYNDMRRAYNMMYENKIQYPTEPKKKFSKDKTDPGVAAGRKAAKEMGLKHNEETDYTLTELEVIGDFLIENGFISDAESVDAFYAHMSDEWKSQILEKADDNGNTSCWDSHKKVGMKKKGGKMVNDCVPK